MSKPAFEDVFSFSGRRNRKSYLIAGSLQLLGLVLLALIVLAAVATESQAVAVGALVLCAIPFMALCVAGWAVASQRCRDFGWTGWSVVLTAIPYLGWAFALAIMLIPGTSGSNRYGPDPLWG